MVPRLTPDHDKRPMHVAVVTTAALTLVVKM